MFLADYEYDMENTTLREQNAEVLNAKLDYPCVIT